MMRVSGGLRVLVDRLGIGLFHWYDNPEIISEYLT